MIPIDKHDNTIVNSCSLPLVGIVFRRAIARQSLAIVVGFVRLRGLGLLSLVGLEGS